MTGDLTLGILVKLRPPQHEGSCRATGGTFDVPPGSDMIGANYHERAANLLAGWKLSSLLAWVHVLSGMRWTKGRFS